MRIERVSPNQFTIFLTFDDLLERGFTKEDLWYDAVKVRNLFSDMMYEASSELGIELEGELVVQVHLMQAQGMHVIVTQEVTDVEWDEEFIEMKVTLDESEELIFSFHDFEDMINVAGLLSHQSIQGGQVFYFDHRYYLLLEESDLNDHDKDDIIAILSEYATPSIITSHRLLEYGKMIYQNEAIQQIHENFY
ncbi:MAG TPA: genetic competence negative regulator [Cerasibacillus sp.]|uniref:genetic competence negative regulator n=1 Tax=Cerasibacillus sp. TaxID=2498711 RepID=UPI002F4046C4